ncbi:MAG: PHP domain-containing protein, partial [Aquiluna sp.]
MIDLHTHSNRSDGLDTPTELVQKAAACGISVLAITDHDTTSGWDEA